MKERLILNHLTILYNLFGSEHLPRILYLRMKTQFNYIKPFLILLNIFEKPFNNDLGPNIRGYLFENYVIDSERFLQERRLMRLLLH